MSSHGLHAAEEKIRAGGQTEEAVRNFGNAYQRLESGESAMLPSAELDPFGTALAAFYPLPNVAGAAAVNKNNYSYNDPAVTVTNDYVARIDHVLGSKDNLYGRFLGEPSHTETADVFPIRGTDGFLDQSMRHARTRAIVNRDDFRVPAQRL